MLRRVQKLLAIAQDDRANPNEAAAAASQAEKIMRKYQIDNEEAITREVKAGQNLIVGQVVATAKDNGTPVDKVPPWAQWLGVAIAGLNDCGARNGRKATDKGYEACINFYGYEADVQVCVWMFEYLVATTNRLCKEARSDYRYLEGGRSWMHSYRSGVSQGILSSVNRLAAEKKAEQQAAVTQRALVVVKEHAITEKFGTFTYGTGKSACRCLQCRPCQGPRGGRGVSCLGHRLRRRRPRHETHWGCVMKHKYIRHSELGFVLWPHSDDLYHRHVGDMVRQAMPAYKAQLADPAKGKAGYPAALNQIISAGFVKISRSPDTVVCYGESESLGIKSRPDDSAALAKQLGLAS